MRGYSYEEVFVPIERALFRVVTDMVDCLPELRKTGRWRCHELSRGVLQHLRQSRRLREGGVLLDERIFVVDGKYGPVDHSWIAWPKHYSQPRILDVYAVGRLPMVQLIDVSSLLVHQGEHYRAGKTRDDIREDDVHRLVDYWVREGL